MLIGIDGGGTKTDICLAHEDGTIVARRRLKGINASGLGAEIAFGRLVMQIAGIAGRVAGSGAVRGHRRRGRSGSRRDRLRA